MKTFKTTILSLLLVFLGISLVQAQGDLISAADMAKKMKDKSLTIVSVRKASNYKKSHLQGAVNINLKDLVSSTEPEGVLKSPSDLAKIFGKKGIDGKKAIVIYDDGKMKYAGRMYWIFKYLGVKDVKLLHRDLKAWKKARLRITKVATKVNVATFTPKLNKAIYVDMNWVKAHLNDANVVLVDVRPLDQYNGTSSKPVSKGHIPNAKHLDMTQVLNAASGLKPKAQILSLAKKIGATSDKTIVVYCNSATRAGIVYFAFKSILGYPMVKVYEGAYNEWIMNNKVVK